MGNFYALRRLWLALLFTVAAGFPVLAQESEPEPSPTSDAPPSGFFALLWQILKSIVWFVQLAIDVFADPLGALNSFACLVIDLLDTVWFFSTPDSMTVTALVSAAGSAFPLIGAGIIWEIIQAIQWIFIIWVVLKIYKLLPFKAS